MIIVVGDDTGRIEPVCTQFKQKGYLYSVVPDDKKAGDAARAARTGLLVIDTTCSSFDGFKLCKTVKNDKALSGLPVLLLTGLADLSVLLNVLDCGADAFITLPYDPPSLLSTIDDLLKAQEEKKPRSAVRTRFVIAHEGRKYSVVADRRQLLEFLLSTFEIAVRSRKEQEQAIPEMMHAIGELNKRISAITGERDTVVRNLHNDLEERNRTITSLTASFQEKEQQESLLHTQSENLLQDLSRKSAELEDQKRLFQEKSAHVAAMEGQVASTREEKEQTEQNLHRQIDELDAKIERLDHDRSATTMALEQEQRVHASVEAELAALRETHARAQQFLDSASRDIGVLNTALAEQKEKQRKVEEHLDAVIRESENKDRAMQAINEDRAALKNELQAKRPEPSGSNAQRTAPSGDIPDTEHELQVSDVPPLFAEASERGEKEPKHLLILPKAAPMKLTEPLPAIPLPEGPVPMPAVPAAEPPPGKAGTEKDGHDIMAETDRTANTSSSQAEKIPADWAVNRNLWFDMVKWVHHTDTISPDLRKELLDSLMKTSRLVQQGRHLTGRQQDSMRALLFRMQALGYRFH